ncbi:MAG: hypothetical protein WCH76_07205 [Candidatus Riflemargulisbacteria bacterium]
MKTGDKVYIHYHDADGIGYGDSINTTGIIVREERNGTILVEYKDEYFYMKKQKEFYPHDLTLDIYTE